MCGLSAQTIAFYYAPFGLDPNLVTLFEMEDDALFSSSDLMVVTGSLCTP